MIKVCHLTSAHTHFDVRIFTKQCTYLATCGYDVSLVAPGAPDQIINGVHLHGVPRLAKGRFYRMTNTVNSVYQKAKTINAELYHIHDPELIPLALMLKWSGKKIVFDMHEDMPKQILNKYWIPKLLRKVISFVYSYAQLLFLSAFNAVVLAETSYAYSLPAKCNYFIVRNYPILSEIRPSDNVNKEKAVCYVGQITVLRGVLEMIGAAGKLDAKILLAGEMPDSFRVELSTLKGWENVEALGELSRQQVSEVLSRSRAGLVILHPAPNYVHSEPTKMFEYMAAGLPVIASDFPLWREIVESNACGLCVNPLDVDDVASAIDWILSHPEEAERMGRNGRQAVESKYNWDEESKTLSKLYGELLKT